MLIHVGARASRVHMPTRSAQALDAGPWAPGPHESTRSVRAQVLVHVAPGPPRAHQLSGGTGAGPRGHQALTSPSCSAGALVLVCTGAINKPSSAIF